ncbi:DNA-3-methyladenine glycosylase family protein [Alkaliphilus transvaalensis]|uniref:DNA-3-methyladenine glycosylase family protein n=1 Tax=Alkaliphilus transvaalensis TaxID=114628 RepID=UPI00047D1FCE|nr:DNA glycosylase [Alkaliphilus transvaalensis]
MKFNMIERDNSVILINAEDFEPKHIFECGQCFRWDQEADGSYTGVAFNRVINVKKENNEIIIDNTNKKDFEEIWTSYFDLETNYGAIKDRLVIDDPVMKQATTFGSGIRILRQDLWETVISFIISANNNIPRIKKIVNSMSEKYGDFIGTYKGKNYYSFPKPEVIAQLTKDSLMSCNTGYRAAYIINTAIQVSDNGLIVGDYQNPADGDYLKKLMELNGVGPKVANCIAFFSLGKLEAFPIDVWVKRLMEHFYFCQETPGGEIQRFAKEKFGQHAGYAQQYLFYYGRELGIGKGDKKDVRDSR